MIVLDFRARGQCPLSTHSWLRAAPASIAHINSDSHYQCMSNTNLTLPMMLLVGSAAVVVSSAALAQTVAPPRPNCSSPAHHQLDFWIGQWTVYNTADNVEYATSRIVSLEALFQSRELGV